MFIVSLPGDLAIRREHRRLTHRDREVAVRRGTDPADPGA